MDLLSSPNPPSSSSSPSPQSPSPTAPLATEPQHLLVVLNLARRKALYQLVSDITTFMISRLDLQENPFNNQPNNDARLFTSAEPTRPSSSSTMATDMTSTTIIPTPASPSLLRLRLAARDDLTNWRKSLLTKLQSLRSAQDTPPILEARRKRQEKLVQASHPTSMDLLGLDPFASLTSSASDQDAAAVRARNLYKPFDTRLSTLTPRDKEEILSALLLQLLADGKYVAHDRALLCHLCASFSLPLAILDREEASVAETLISSQAKMEADKASQAKRKDEGQSSRYWKVGLASVAGAAVIGITGGLAAPVVAGAIGGIMGGVGLGGLASFMGVFWMNGALVGTLFGAYGAKMGGQTMDAYAREVEDFGFESVKSEGKNAPGIGKINGNAPPKPRLRLTIGINSLITEESDIVAPWQDIPPDTEVHALRYEKGVLVELSRALNSLLSAAAWKVVRAEVLKRTVLVTLSAALWPAWLLGSAASQLDNPFSRARNMSDKAGKVLADALVARVQGQRPVTLVGFSLGARVVAQCLQSLAERRVFGVVEDVVLIGAPVPKDSAYWAVMRTVASGRVVNVFSSKDLVLAFMYRASSVQMGIAGLHGVEGVEGVMNVDLSEEVDGHMKYISKGNMGKILTRCGFEGIMGGGGKIDGISEEVVSEAGGGGEGDLLDLNNDGAADKWGEWGEWQEDQMDRMTKDLEGLGVQEEERNKREVAAISQPKGKSKRKLVSHSLLDDDLEAWPTAEPTTSQSKTSPFGFMPTAGLSSSTPVFHKSTTTPVVPSSHVVDVPQSSLADLAVLSEPHASADKDKTPELTVLSPGESQQPGIPPRAMIFPVVVDVPTQHVGPGEYAYDEEEEGIVLEDNDGDMGIQMEDNDGILDYAEPIPVEDY